MRNISSVIFLSLGILALGFTLDNAYAQLGPNNAFFLEGAGFALTDAEIKSSEIDVALATGNQRGSSSSIIVQDGFVTLDEFNFLVSDLTGSALRGDSFIRINGVVEDSFGDQASLSLFGKLIQNTDEGSIYSFTGRLTFEGEVHKVVYTSKLIEFGATSDSTITTSLADPQVRGEGEQVKTPEADMREVHILFGASLPGIVADSRDIGEAYNKFIESRGSANVRLNYFAPDRIIASPGTQFTIYNDDEVPHTIVSGTGLGTHSRIQGQMIICDFPAPDLGTVEWTQTNCAFNIDGRINTGTIPPGGSFTGTLDDYGFYRFIDPDYPWMQIVMYSFPETDSTILSPITANPYAKQARPLN